MHYLIDGHNLIARVADISLDDPHDEAKLVLLLRKWTARDRKRRITIIFDRGVPGGEDRLLSRGKLKVVFASTGRTADDLLIFRIRNLSDPAGYTVVSSDGEVVAAALKRKISVISSQDFALSLDRLALGFESGEPRDDPELSEAEISEWLKLFEDSD